MAGALKNVFAIAVGWAIRWVSVRTPSPRDRSLTARDDEARHRDGRQPETFPAWPGWRPDCHCTSPRSRNRHVASSSAPENHRRDHHVDGPGRRGVKAASVIMELASATACTCRSPRGRRRCQPRPLAEDAYAGLAARRRATKSTASASDSFGRNCIPGRDPGGVTALRSISAKRRRYA